MPIFFKPKSTVFYLSICFLACVPKQKAPNTSSDTVDESKDGVKQELVIAANNTEAYLPKLNNKSIAIVANQTSVIFKKPKGEANSSVPVHIVDSLLQLHISIAKVFAPEHGFRGKADAGELVKDGVDTKTGLPIISLYGKNKKPKPQQLEGVDLVVFDIQDVGVRFYTYIATLQLVMEACAEAKVPVMVLDRPNPNAHYVDGPTMEKEHTGFLGMQPIPLVYGMTIGEYAQMINEEGWLANSKKVELTVIPLTNYDRDVSYILPIRPSPNLPNAKATNLYPSLGLFEGTSVNAGRGTEFQFQRYGASFLDSTAFDFQYVPQPNFGSKYPKEKGKRCFGEDLSGTPRMTSVSLEWLIKAYQNTRDKNRFFKTNSFTKHVGTTLLQRQIIDGVPETEIKMGWKSGIENFKKIRSKYLRYD